MIKDNQKYFNRMLVIIDAAIAAFSYILAWYLKFDSPFANIDPSVGVLTRATYFRMLYFIVPGYLILCYYFHLYTSKRSSRHRYEIISIIQANTVGVLLLMVVFYAMKQVNFSRSMLIYFYIINIILSAIFRTLLRLCLRFFRHRGYNLRYVLLVGYSRAAEAYIDRLNANPQWGYVVRGILDDDVPRGTIYKGAKVLGDIANLEFILPEHHLDEIAITLPLSDYDRLEQIVAACEKSGVHTKFVPDYNSLFPSHPYTEDLMGLQVVNIRYVPLSNTLNWIIKRIVDVVVSVIGIIVSSPFMLVSAIAIKLTSPGPVIFKQERVGLRNKTFMMYKFRTMTVSAENQDENGWTVPNDPRVTKVGKFLRKTSIDELPQLFNILAGQMSVVGPRPERPQFVEKFQEEIPRYLIKHQVRPGLTGWAQVNGYRGDTSIKRRVEYDIYYIENWSLGFDFKIMFLTVFKGFINKNAY